MEIKSAKFLKSVMHKSNFYDDDVVEIAFVGRSNAGKSSLLNNLSHNSSLAKTSKTPGRTRMINYFLINNSFRFVDLPGYGFHQAGKVMEENWANLMEDYLTMSKNLSLVILLLDIRHEPSKLDLIMIDFLFSRQIPFIVVATKTDKVAKSKINNYLTSLSKKIKIPVGNIFPHSIMETKSREKILNYIENFLTKDN